MIHELNDFSPEPGAGPSFALTPPVPGSLQSTTATGAGEDPASPMQPAPVCRYCNGPKSRPSADACGECEDEFIDEQYPREQRSFAEMERFSLEYHR